MCSPTSTAPGAPPTTPPGARRGCGRLTIATSWPASPTTSRCATTAGCSATRPRRCSAWRNDVRAGDEEGLAQLLASAVVPNIYVKASGFHYASARSWDHPWPDALDMLKRVVEAYGPRRICWGSDFPASTRFCTFRQSLEAVRTHCGFLTSEDLALLLGGTLREVLTGRASGRSAPS